MTSSEIIPLQKVTLAIGAAPSEDRVLLPADEFFTLVFGAAPRGLCQFESRLAERHSGETIAFSLRQEQVHEFFGHLFMPLKTYLKLEIMPQLLFFEVEIIKVEEPEQREVISAMKDYLGGGCGGGCDCGCH